MNKLIFVYNADAGLFSTLTDFTHKILSPGTYSCNLCKLTYGNFQMKKQWQEYLQRLPIEKEFLHKDEFVKKFSQMADLPLPAILVMKEDTPKVFLSAQDINSQNDLKGLIDLFDQKLRAL